MAGIAVLGGAVRVEPREGYLFVWHGRAARDVPELEIVIRAIGEAMRAQKTRRLLFDSRESEMTPPEVGQRLWSWLEEAKLERVGTLVKSSLLGTSVRMRGLSRKVNIRAFDDESAAEKWLRD